MYEKIINEIKSNLTGDKKQDKEYLASQLLQYGDHKYSKEISRELGRLLWNCLSDEEKDGFSKIAEDENPVKDAYKQAMEYMRNNDSQSAIDCLDSFFNSYPFSFKDDSVNEYHSFSNPIEEMIFNYNFKTDKIIRLIPPYQLYVEIHHLYGFLLIEFERFEQAEEILDYAIKLNPVFTSTLFERAEIFKYKKDFESFYTYSRNALKYSYFKFDLARAYRNLGFYYIEKDNLKLASALFIHSLTFEFSQNAISELEYIKSLGFDDELSEDDVKGLLFENGIRDGVNPLIYGILSQLIMKEAENKNHNNLLFYYHILYDLTGDEEILEKINELKESVQ